MGTPKTKGTQSDQTSWAGRPGCRWAGVTTEFKDAFGADGHRGENDARVLDTLGGWKAVILVTGKAINKP